MYRDRYGNQIKAGDVVAQRITINHETFKGFAFSTTVCRRMGRCLILDGVHGFCYLKELDPSELAKIMPDTQLAIVNADFLRDRRREES